VPSTTPVQSAISEVRTCAGLSQEGLARVLGVSFVSVNRWERGASSPSPAQSEKIFRLLADLQRTGALPRDESQHGVFASRGARTPVRDLPLFDEPVPTADLLAEPRGSLLAELERDGVFEATGREALPALIESHSDAAATAERPPESGVSAGKNSYTYDAHTYHTKVPPQGIAELLNHYLPSGGLVLDPFAGSGMTGVAALATGHDCILNELSPAACFIANRFTARIEANDFRSAARSVLRALDGVRRSLYTTECRECGRTTEILYTVWSYRVLCSGCEHEFLLWDVCRHYGNTVREHKILREFDCPSCGQHLVKSRLARTAAEPVQLGYVCCGSRQQEVVHPLTAKDHERLRQYEREADSLDGFVPRVDLPDGVNLSQPKRHGLDRIDKFYTARNLIAMSALWRAIHRVPRTDVAAHLAFVFTSLYQRVTKLSEFRFWGGSGNTARFNVPFIFNEANVFVTFERKARSIEDHLLTTATHYTARSVVLNGSATRLDSLPDNSVDLIFTDPPFGANINYSEMNLLWEAWLGAFTNPTDEAIMSRSQGKSVDDYQRLMTKSLEECFRVLRPGHWMLLVFMNSSGRVWEALRQAVLDAGFSIERADSFDKQHGTFKQFVSANTAGEDLVLHCRKSQLSRAAIQSAGSAEASVRSFLTRADVRHTRTVYLHVDRPEEIDVRKLYSEWLAAAMVEGAKPIDMAAFRELVLETLAADNT
jgi:DNA modification methylase/transcriptional regulator with XRE-family HTH domain/ribosomal protein S27E